MEGGRIFDSCDDMLALLDSPNNSLWVPQSSFHETMANFDQEPQGSGKNPKRGRGYEGEDTGEEESDANMYQTEKKRRLTAEQVEFLEKSFETENKLDPERKEKLAKQLGLQSKQVAIWFQNRRARYKTKQIEKEFDTLKASYDSLKDDYDSLCMENEKLQNEVEILKKKLAQKHINDNNSNPENIMHSQESMSINETSGKELGELVMARVEDASSAKSDVLDSESPHWTDGNQTSTVIEASSTPVRGPNQHSDISADDEEHFMMNENLLLPQTPPTFNNFLKVADDGYYDPSGSSCNLSILDNQPFWSWLY